MGQFWLGWLLVPVPTVLEHPSPCSRVVILLRRRSCHGCLPCSLQVKLCMRGCLPDACLIAGATKHSADQLRLLLERPDAAAAFTERAQSGLTVGEAFTLALAE